MPLIPGRILSSSKSRAFFKIRRLNPTTTGDNRAGWSKPTRDRPLWRKDNLMDKWQCLLCGYIYDPEEETPLKA